MGRSLGEQNPAGKPFPPRPYLSWIANPATAMRIRYSTSAKQADIIFYGSNQKLNQRVMSNYGTQKEVNLSDLIPGTEYQYRIGQNGNLYSFRTAPSGTASFSFVVYGDYNSSGKPRIKRQLYQMVAKEYPGFLLFTGDLVSNGNNPNKWKNQFFAPIGVLSPYFPLMPAHGNHDGTGSLFSYYFGSSGNYPWYSFVYADALFIALDTESDYSPESPQYQFLATALQGSSAGWKFVYLHQPPYSTNAGHQSNLNVRAVLCPVFEKYGVNIVFSGHNHCYERTQPIYQDGVDLQNGVTYITTGGGGAALHPFIPRENLSTVEKNWIGVRLKRYHYLLVKITGKKIIIAAKNSNGKTIDRMEQIRPLSSMASIHGYRSMKLRSI